VASTYLLSSTASSLSPATSQFPELVDSLRAKGFRPRNEFPCEYFISVNHNPKMYKSFIKSGGDPSKAALIMLEPFAVYPGQYKRSNRIKYSLVLAPGNPKYSFEGKMFVPWPYEAIPNPLHPTYEDFNLKKFVTQAVSKNLFQYENWMGRDRQIVLINANKVSVVSAENYSLRRRFAKVLESETLQVFGDMWVPSIKEKLLHRISVFLFAIKTGIFPNLVHVYGNLHWKFRTASGPIKNKQEILQRAKFSLVIENDDNYVSEKLLDAMINGCIPIYRGGALSTEILPPGLFIDLPENPMDLTKLLDSLSEEEIKMYLSNISSFITSPSFLNYWDKHIVFEQIASILNEYFGGTDD
jgi:hypothetical protein